MSSEIVCYLDCVSPYSYFALLYLERNRAALKSHNVQIDVIPVFLGGINVGSGNKPPWTLPAKAKYSGYDSARAKKYFGATDIRTPSFFPILSLLPQRALSFIKSRYSDEFIPTFLDLFSSMWKDQLDVSKPDLLFQVLSKRFAEAQIREILASANSPEYKQILNESTQEALKKGAFGCPWFWVRNREGLEEPFFGSDRFHFMWEFLGLPWKDFELPMESKAKI